MKKIITVLSIAAFMLTGIATAASYQDYVDNPVSEEDVVSAVNEINEMMAEDQKAVSEYDFSESYSVYFMDESFYGGRTDYEGVEDLVKENTYGLNVPVIYSDGKKGTLIFTVKGNAFQFDGVCEWNNYEKAKATVLLPSEINKVIADNFGDKEITGIRNIYVAAANVLLLNVNTTEDEYLIPFFDEELIEADFVYGKVYKAEEMTELLFAYFAESCAKGDENGGGTATASKQAEYKFGSLSLEMFSKNNDKTANDSTSYILSGFIVLLSGIAAVVIYKKKTNR